MTNVSFNFKSSFSLMSFGCSIAFSSGGMILWGRSACSPSIATPDCWAHFVVDSFHFQFPLIHHFSVDVFHVAWSMHLWCFLECLLFSLSPSVDHKFFVLLAVFLDVEFSIKCESLFCRVDLVFVEWYWNNSGWYLCLTVLSISFAVLEYYCCCWHWVANHFLVI